MNELIFIGYVSLVCGLILVIPKSLGRVYKHVVFSIVFIYACITVIGYPNLSQSLHVPLLIELGFLVIVLVASINALNVVSKETEE